MEYLALGDLSQYIITAISEEETKQIANDLLQELKIMHAEGFTHRDLKPQVGSDPGWNNYPGCKESVSFLC